MRSGPPASFRDVEVVCKANVYFDGRVVSHTVLLSDGSKKTLGLIHAGRFRFDTDAPELMELVAGSCSVRLAGGDDWVRHDAGSSFRVPGRSSFEIEVDSGIAEYVCSFY